MEKLPFVFIPNIWNYLPLDFHQASSLFHFQKHLQLQRLGDALIQVSVSEYDLIWFTRTVLFSQIFSFQIKK